MMISPDVAWQNNESQVPTSKCPFCAIFASENVFAVLFFNPFPLLPVFCSESSKH